MHSTDDGRGGPAAETLMVWRNQREMENCHIAEPEPFCIYPELPEPEEELDEPFIASHPHCDYCGAEFVGDGPAPPICDICLDEHARELHAEACGDMERDER